VCVLVRERDREREIEVEKENVREVKNSRKCRTIFYLVSLQI
jgi:hypothetical protein